MEAQGLMLLFNVLRIYESTASTPGNFNLSLKATKMLAAPDYIINPREISSKQLTYL